MSSESPAPASASIRQWPPYWINRAAYAFRGELQQAFERAGIDSTPEEWALQRVLFEQGALGVGELAALTVRDRTTVTRLLDALERKQLVQRQPDPADRRRTCVSLSARGQALHPRLLAHVKALIERGSQGISAEEMHITTSVLQRMVENLSGSGSQGAR